MEASEGEVVIMTWTVEACNHHAEVNGAKDWIFDKVQDALRQKGKCKNCLINIYERATQ